MKLGIDGWRLQGQRTGVGRYLLNVLSNWTEDVVKDRFEEITLYSPRARDRTDAELPSNIAERVLPPPFRMLLWQNLRLGPVADDEVLFCPSYTRPIFLRCRTVVTIFEATMHFFPEYYPWSARIFYRRLYGWSARHATLVITSSEAAAQDVAQAYGVPLSRIRPIHLAPAERFVPVSDRGSLERVGKRYLGEDCPFFLFVGKLTARRNIPKLLEAFAEFKKENPGSHKLLLVGLNSTNLDLAQRSSELGIEGDFFHREYVPDEDLNLLYNASEAFVLPYSYESGFSLTAVEAQATGTPVITVDAPGLREVTGGAALYAARAEVPDIVRAMSRVASDASYRQMLSERGLENVLRFSWQKCAQQTLDVIEQAARL
jgi:glycosyltransferase involved in cell wall biosynthesis